jgi:surfeit locus 1 family protein
MNEMTKANLRPLLVPGLMTLVGVAILVTLGVWQMERLHWKEALLARIDARIHAPPSPLPPESDWANWSADADEYGHVKLAGTFLHNKEILVHMNAPRDRNGDVKLGYAVITPLRLDNGAVVLINRGFVPTQMNKLAAGGFERPFGMTDVTGLMRASQERGWFVPPNEPARGEWFSRNIDEIAAAKNLTRVAPFIVDADVNPDAAAKWPRGGLTVVSFPNNHFEYALTWFGLAAGLLGVFAVWALGRLKGERRAQTPEIV